DHACQHQHQWRADHALRRHGKNQQPGVQRLLLVARRQGPRGRKAHVRCTRAGRSGAAAAGRDLLREELRHGGRQVRRGLDDHRGAEALMMTASNPAAATAKSPDFVISRVFDAPRELVWKCFTEPERMKEWWGPKGFTVIASKMDFRVGGTYHYGLKAPNG